MRISYAVMAHPKRARAAVLLSDVLGGCPIAVDDVGYGETVNGDRAWAAYNPDAEWHVVMQDDAVPVPQITDRVRAALTYAPRGLVSLYTGTGRPKSVQAAVGRAIARADENGTAWLAHPKLLWGVAVAMPTALIPGFLAWGERVHAPYDQRLSMFGYTHLPTFAMYTWPSLVDHADGPTLLDHPWGRPDGPRRAWRTGVPARWDTHAEVIA